MPDPKQSGQPRRNRQPATFTRSFHVTGVGWDSEASFVAIANREGPQEIPPSRDPTHRVASCVKKSIVRRDDGASWKTYLALASSVAASSPIARPFSGFFSKASFSTNEKSMLARSAYGA